MLLKQKALTLPDAESGLIKSRAPDPAGSVVLLLGLALTWVTLGGGTATGMGRQAAYMVGASLGLSALFDLRNGWPNLLRADLLALFGLYFLTLAEFAYPGADFDSVFGPVLPVSGVGLCLLGFASLATGRHIHVQWQPKGLVRVMNVPVHPAFMIRFFWICFIVGYLHMLMAVDFNPIKMVDYWLEPRFSQPWGRGKFGDWKALFYELSMLLYLIPPLGGVLLARRHRYSKRQLIPVTAGLLLTLFQGFSSGTRNVFLTYLVTFLVGYVFASSAKQRKETLVLTAVSITAGLLAAQAMLQFRTTGLRSWQSAEEKSPYEELSFYEANYFIDNNLYVIHSLSKAFPSVHEHLGWEVPYWALVKPVPRAIWSGKPEGLSQGIEDSLGAEGLTLAATFIGEGYMAAGVLGVILAGLFFGAVARWWNQFYVPSSSDFALLIYASGFFAIGISMRSLFMFTTAVLPTIAAVVYGELFLRRERAARQREEARQLSLPPDGSSHPASHPDHRLR